PLYHPKTYVTQPPRIQHSIASASEPYKRLTRCRNGILGQLQRHVIPGFRGAFWRSVKQSPEDSQSELRRSTARIDTTDLLFPNGRDRDRLDAFFCRLRDGVFIPRRLESRRPRDHPQCLRCLYRDRLPAAELIPCDDLVVLRGTGSCICASTLIATHDPAEHRANQS